MIMSVHDTEIRVYDLTKNYYFKFPAKIEFSKKIIYRKEECKYKRPNEHFTS